MLARPRSDNRMPAHSDSTKLGFGNHKNSEFLGFQGNCRLEIVPAIILNLMYQTGRFEALAGLNGCVVVG